MANTLAPGSVLNGRYRIDGVAGSGGMGAVYRAFDTGLGGRSVAVKEMSEEGLSPQEITEATSAFQQEAHLLARLQHPNLPRIHDHFTDNGRWYLVMDFIEGETLDDYLRRYGTPGLPVDTVLHIAAQICAVLQYLHGHVPPIVFRDLKPSNVMLAAGFHVYLLDFGIARIFKPGASHDTHAIGTEGYAAPEQFGKSQTTVRSDIFSFGATLHQLLTGVDPAVKPFTFSAIHPLNPLVPARLVALITWMVQMDEQKRPPNMGVVHQELTWIAAQASPNSNIYVSAVSVSCAGLLCFLCCAEFHIGSVRGNVRRRAIAQKNCHHCWNISCCLGDVVHCGSGVFFGERITGESGAISEHSCCAVSGDDER